MNRDDLKLLAGIISLVVGVVMVSSALTPYDDSDIPPNRSGMRVYRDALTGCEYVGGASMGITPRLRPDGTQVCRPNPGRAP